MKKQNLLKLALVSIAMMVFTGAWAQNPASIQTNYVELDETIYQTVGFNLTLIVLPDLALSPDYDAVTNTLYSASSEWRWMHTAWDALDNTNLVEDWANENTLTVTPPTAGNTLTYYVAERYGTMGCVSATIEDKTVAGVAQPDITAFAAANTGGWTYNAGDDRYEICAALASDAIDITIEETGSLAAMQNYTYGITVTRIEYDGNMAVVGSTDQTATWGQIADLDAMTAGLSQSFTITDLAIINDGSTDVPTEYQFTFTASSLASTTSRVSDFRAGGDGTLAFFDNFTAAATISYVLFPTPTTGPIYHIPNNYAF